MKWDIFPDVTGKYKLQLDEITSQLKPTAASRDLAGGSAIAERQLFRDSGLLKLAIPHEYGGLGANWTTIFQAIRRIAQVDSSLAHLFGFQHLQVATILLLGNSAQKNELLRATVDMNWFWGNAVNTRDARLIATKCENGWRLNGIKSFCSGAKDSNALILTAVNDKDDKSRLFISIPTTRTGIEVKDDWDNMGQRQTDSGTVIFTDVNIADHEVLTKSGATPSLQASLRNMIGQIILTEIYIGNAQGALLDSIEYNQTTSRPWVMSGAPHASEDSFNQLNSGKIWSNIKASMALANESHGEFDQCWNNGVNITEQERAELSMTVAASRTYAAQMALESTSRSFELMGASATTTKLRADRYWRNVRVHTLHDPIDYRYKEIGSWLLTKRTPNANGYG
jgi:alkylation response protein AidB-like acyl-CoA dehydrogenase